MSLKAIAFDIDGTLYPAHRLYTRFALTAIANARFLIAFSNARKTIRELADTREYRAEPPENLEDFRRFQAALVAQHLDSDEARAASLIERVVYRDSIEIFANIKPFPGTLSALESLKAAGFRLAALSDFPTERKLDLLGLSAPFDFSFSSEETGFLKPAPEPFAELCRRLDLPPADVLYVGNSMAFDVRGAQAFGMKTAHVTNSGRITSIADFSFSDYRDLVAWIGAGAPVNIK